MGYRKSEGKRCGTGVMAGLPPANHSVSWLFAVQLRCEASKVIASDKFYGKIANADEHLVMLSVPNDMGILHYASLCDPGTHGAAWCPHPFDVNE